MTPETPLLTIEQRKRLITRDEKKESELEAYKKRHNDQVVLKKFGDYIESLPDVLLILKHMPPEKITKKLSPDKIPAMLDLIEDLLAQIDPWPIGVSEDENGVMAFRVLGNAIPSADPGKCAIFSIARSATPEEIDLDWHLTEHFNKIRCFVDPCVPDPVCRDPKYIGMQGEKIFKLRKELGGPFSVSNNAYLDETGVSKDGWIITKHSMVDINQLQWMRWKPIGLKECMEKPPLLAPKKIPRGPEIMRLRMECNAEGTRYLISEKGGEERSVTKEEFLEAHRKFEGPKATLLEEDIKHSKESK